MVSSSSITIPQFPGANAPIDSSRAIVGSVTIESDGTTGPIDPVRSIYPTDPTDPIDRIDPDMNTSLAPAILRTEPNFRCAAAPGNPSMGETRNQPNVRDVAGDESEPQSADVAGCEKAPNRPLVFGTVLLLYRGFGLVRLQSFGGCLAPHAWG